MALSAGTRLGPDEIVSPLGVGGPAVARLAEVSASYGAAGGRR